MHEEKAAEAVLWIKVLNIFVLLKTGIFILCLNNINF